MSCSAGSLSRSRASPFHSHVELPWQTNSDTGSMWHVSPWKLDRDTGEKKKKYVVHAFGSALRLGLGSGSSFPLGDRGARDHLCLVNHIYKV